MAMDNRPAYDPSRPAVALKDFPLFGERIKAGQTVPDHLLRQAGAQRAEGLYRQRYFDHQDGPLAQTQAAQLRQAQEVAQSVGPAPENPADPNAPARPVGQGEEAFHATSPNGDPSIANMQAARTMIGPYQATIKHRGGGRYIVVDRFGNEGTERMVQEDAQAAADAMNRRAAEIAAARREQQAPDLHHSPGANEQKAAAAPAPEREKVDTTGDGSRDKATAASVAPAAAPAPAAT